MNSTLNSRRIASGVGFNSVTDSRFKTNRISINFITELNKNNVTTNAILPFILKKGHRGCADFTTFNQELQELYGAHVDGYVQKVGDYQILSLAITCIDDKFSLDGESITDKASQILCGLALDPILENNAFKKDDVQIEKTALIDTIEAEINEKRIYAINNLVKLMCHEEPFGIPKYGFKEQAEKLTPEGIKSGYDNLLNTSRIEIMFTGCSHVDSAFDVFKSIFNSIDRNYVELKPITIHKASSGNEKTDKLQVNQSKIVLGFANNLKADDQSVIATKLMVAILGGTVTSKLFVNVREKLSLCYYCAARYDRFKGIMMIDSGVETQNIEVAKKEIINQLQSIKDGDITDEEIKNARLSVINTLNTVFDCDSSIESWYMGQILGGTNVSPMQEAIRYGDIPKDLIIAAANNFSLDSTYILTGNEE